jgi:nucleoside-diphosphate-sugar epimerase
MRVLIIGGTRFIGLYLSKILVEQGHEVVLFNRGNHPPGVPGIVQIQGDRTDAAQLQRKLADENFDAIFDNNGRQLTDTQPLAQLFKGRVQHFIYMSSAGVYLKSDQMPHREDDPTDPKSRHLGKAASEADLAAQGLPYTAIRPTYIYGPKNYNDLEAWFFDRIVRKRPLPIPGNGQHITQLGHVQDLALAMASVLGNRQTIGQVYNVSGDRYVTFDGLAKACAQAAGQSPDQLELIHYDPKAFDFGKRKAFPLRLQHFFADIHKASRDLNWQPQYDLVTGLQESFQQDYLATGREKVDIDVSLDDEILAAVKG